MNSFGKFVFLVPGGLQYRAYDILRMSIYILLRYETLLVRAPNKIKKSEELKFLKKCLEQLINIQIIIY